MHPLSCFRRFKYDAHPRVQDAGDPPQGAEGVAFVVRRLKPANLLLRGIKQFREVLLREPGLFAQRGDL